MWQLRLFVFASYIMQEKWPWNMFNHVIFIWTSWCTERPYQFGNIALGLSMTQGWLICRKMIHNRYEYRYMSLINSLSRVPNVRFVQKCTFALIRVFVLKIFVLIADWSNFYCSYWPWIEVENLQNEKWCLTKLTKSVESRFWLVRSRSKYVRRCTYVGLHTVS